MIIQITEYVGLIKYILVYIIIHIADYIQIIQSMLGIIIYPDHMILRCNKPKGILIQMVFTSRMFVKDVCTYYRMIIIHPDHMVLV